MKIQLVLMSILTYTILLNGCLTFRLNLSQNLIVVTIITSNIVFTSKLIGTLSVIPMLAMLILYAGWLQKDSFLLHAFLIIFSYLFIVILDNLTHLVWNIFGLTLSRFWPLYMFIDYPVFFILCRFLSKKTVFLKKNNTTSVPKVLVVIGINLTLCLLIFIIHIKIAEQTGSTSFILFLSIILYTSYFIHTIFMIITIIKEYNRNANIMMKQQSYDNLKEYMSNIEELYQGLRTFKHDYANVMISMTGFLESNNLEGLKNYYDREIDPLNRQLYKENDTLTRLLNLNILELKSLISVKLNYALEHCIKVNLEISEEIETISMNRIDLVRIIGILLDNAIEASQECNDPTISVSIIKTKQGTTFIIKNTYIKKKMDYSKLGSVGFSSKGERRGTGLYNMKTIAKQYQNVTIDTEYDESYFTQIMEIYHDDKEAVK